MASSFEKFLRVEKHADGDTTWGAGARANLDAIGYALHGQRVLEVDPHWTTGNLFPGVGSPDSERRKFNTIQAAIDEAEGNAWSEYLILCNQGTYNENLVITKSVTISAIQGSGGFYPSGVQINGVTTVADSVFTISPANSTFVYVELIGLSLENAYNQTNASEITEPYLIDAQDQGAYSGTRNKLILKNCYVRMQTWGGDVGNGGNVWTYGIKAKGNWHVIADGCQMTALAHGGGQNDGVVRRLFDVRGNNAQSITALLNCKRCDLDNASYDDGTAPILFYWDDRAQLWVNGITTPFARADSYTKGGTGTQTSGGVEDDPSAALYHNAYGVSGTVVL